MHEAQATQYTDDDRTRVTRWSFSATGDATGPHVHEFDYLVVPVTGGELTVISADGTEKSMVQVAGVPYNGVAGTSHNVVSAGDAPVVFVEVEMKTPSTSQA
ncbi:MAG TPA: cupin [Pseudolysinimonas sp.]|nr:cupin [Pseudolysinimonas sp.]